MTGKLPKQFLNSASRCGLEVLSFNKAGVPHLYIEKNNVLSVGKITGLEIKTERIKFGTKIKITAKKNAKISKPVFLCFGVLNEKGEQTIFPEISLKENSLVRIFTHCTFPSAQNVVHKMEAKINLEKNARLFYEERHFHGETFGTSVFSNFKVNIAEGGLFENKFILDQGTVGNLKIDIEAELQKGAIIEMESKIVGKGKRDMIEISDKVFLKGENSRSLVKLKGVASNGGKLFFRGETAASGKNARGHIDCQEVVVGENSVAQSIPIIRASNPTARITHEASVGKINEKQLETLMTRGLNEKEAIDILIKGRFK